MAPVIKTKLPLLSALLLACPASGPETADKAPQDKQDQGGEAPDRGAASESKSEVKPASGQRLPKLDSAGVIVVEFPKPPGSTEAFAR